MGLLVRQWPGGALPSCECRPGAPDSAESLFLTSLRQVHLPAPGKWGQHPGDATAGGDAVLSDIPVPGGV